MLSFFICSVASINPLTVFFFLFLLFLHFPFLQHPNIFINNQNTVSGRTVEEDNIRGKLCPASLYLIFVLPLWILWLLVCTVCLGPCLYLTRSCQVCVSTILFLNFILLYSFLFLFCYFFFLFACLLFVFYTFNFHFNF